MRNVVASCVFADEKGKQINEKALSVKLVWQMDIFLYYIILGCELMGSNYFY